jgi:hypothetical protein
MKKLSCMLGRHVWTTVVEGGESYRTCAVCGRMPRRRGKTPVTVTDLENMRTSGQSDSSISSGF